MASQQDHDEFEELNEQLNDEHVLEEYRRSCDGYRPSLLPRMLGRLLILCGNVVYGREPSYLKFRAVEVIARVPYHSWSSASYTLLTLFYTDENKAQTLSDVAHYTRLAHDNETMHVVVVSQLAKREGRAGVIRYTIIPMLFAFFYFWSSYILYMAHRRYSFELNYIFEQHAFDQYSRFLEIEGDALRRKPVRSNFLLWYGRNLRSQYEFFRSVRNDELIHRNVSVRGLSDDGSGSK